MGESDGGDIRLVKRPERVGADEIKAEFNDVALSGGELSEGARLRDGANDARCGAEHEVAEACLGTDHRPVC
jgi:hypothetical protein